MARDERAPASDTRYWLCADCGARLGLLAYARGKPPELLPLMPVIAIRGGVIWFRCQRCEALAQWRIAGAA